eukprot:13443793-Alexandrium_andersonii.AAC.1
MAAPLQGAQRRAAPSCRRRAGRRHWSARSGHRLPLHEGPARLRRAIGGSVSASGDASSKTFIFDASSRASLLTKVRWPPLGNGGGPLPQKEGWRDLGAHLDTAGRGRGDTI